MVTVKTYKGQLPAKLAVQVNSAEQEHWKVEASHYQRITNLEIGEWGVDDSTDTDRYFLALEDDSLVGVVCTRQSDEGGVTYVALPFVYVLPTHRGRGIGTLLLESVQQYVKGIPGPSALTLSVSSWNERAKALYSKFGFQTISTCMVKVVL